jgi:hypothetical protein
MILRISFYDGPFSIVQDKYFEYSSDRSSSLPATLTYDRLLQSFKSIAVQSPPLFGWSNYSSFDEL